MLTLLAPRGAPWQGHFRPAPYNVSYECLTVASGASFLLSEPLRSVLRPRGSRGEAPPVRRLPDALPCVQLVWPTTQCVLSFAAGCAGAGVLWLVLATAPLAVLAAATQRQAQRAPAGPREGPGLSADAAEQQGAPERCRTRSGLRRAAAHRRRLPHVPVFSAARLPRSRRATSWRLLPLPYVAWLALQALLHASAMLALSRAARARGDANANAEHLYGDAAGSFGFGAVLPLLLAGAGVRVSASGAQASAGLLDGQLERMGDSAEAGLWDAATG